MDLTAAAAAAAIYTSCRGIMQQHVQHLVASRLRLLTRYGASAAAATGPLLLRVE
jgi:hypothetical protein